MRTATPAGASDHGAESAAVPALARWISILGHPFTFVLILVAAHGATAADRGSALRAGALVLGTVVLPLGLFFWWRRASGRWDTVDASAPRERPALYAAALALMAPLAIAFLISEEPDPMLRGAAAVALMLAVAAVATRWIKLSLHTAFAVFTGVLLVRALPPLGIGILLFAPLLAWSRLRMGRHSPAEVAAGALLGAAIAALTLAL